MPNKVIFDSQSKWSLKISKLFIGQTKFSAYAYFYLASIFQTHGHSSEFHLAIGAPKKSQKY